MGGGHSDAFLRQTSRRRKINSSFMQFQHWGLELLTCMPQIRFLGDSIHCHGKVA